MRGDDRLDRVCLAAVAAALAACVVIAARADLWQPYEPDLVETAREMWVRGDWIHPRLNDLPYLEKPPLYYWSVLCAAHVAGAVTEFAARAPSLLAGAATLVALERFARGLFPAQRRWTAAAICATTPVFVHCASKGMTDALLVAGLVAAARLFHEDVFLDGAAERPAWRRVAAWAALAAAFLAKGPVAPATLALLFIPEAVFARRLGPWIRAWRRQVPGVLCFAALVAPWYVAGTVEGGWGFVRDAVLRQNVVRYVAEGDGDGPFFLLQMFPGQIGAWTVLVPGVVAGALASARWRRDGVFDPVRFLASGSLLVLAFLSCSSGKLPKYLILVAPWYALLAGEVAARLGRGGGAARLLGTGAALTALAAALVAGGLVLPFLAPTVAGSVPGVDAAWLAPVGLALAAGGAVALAAARRRRWDAIVPVLALAPAVAALIVAASPTLERINEAKSTRPFAERAADRMDGTAPLLAYGVSDCESSFVYYAGRTYLLQRRPGDVLRALARSGRVLVLTKASLADDFVRAAPDRLRVVARQQDGPRRYALVEGARRPPG